MKSNVSVCFYSRDIFEKERIIQWLASTDVIHCGIMITHEDLSIVLASDKSHNAKFVDSSAFHRRMMKPKYIIDLGEHDVSIKQLENFMGRTYIGEARSLTFWWFVGRYLFPNYLPKTCALLTSQMLRICGIQVKDHVGPHTLLKELQDATNNNRRPSRSGEDNPSSSNSGTSV